MSTAGKAWRGLVLLAAVALGAGIYQPGWLALTIAALLVALYFAAVEDEEQADDADGIEDDGFTGGEIDR